MSVSVLIAGYLRSDAGRQALSVPVTAVTPAHDTPSRMRHGSSGKASLYAEAAGFRTPGEGRGKEVLSVPRTTGPPGGGWPVVRWSQASKDNPAQGGV